MVTSYLLVRLKFTSAEEELSSEWRPPPAAPAKSQGWQVSLKFATILRALLDGLAPGEEEFQFASVHRTIFVEVYPFVDWWGLPVCLSKQRLVMVEVIHRSFSIFVKFGCEDE